MIRRLIFASALIVMAAGSAQALCSIPSINDNDTIFKFGTTASTESLGAMGTKGSLNARSAGTLYYDHSAGQLKLCDGSSWQNVVSDTAPYVAGSFPKWSVWRRNYAAAPSHPMETAPLVDTGVYRVVFLIEQNNATCRVDLVAPSGAKTAFVTKNNTGSDRWMQVGYTFYGRGGDRYSYAIDGYGTDEANNGGTRNMSMGVNEQGSILWDGRLQFVPGCIGFVSIMRIE